MNINRAENIPVADGIITPGEYPAKPNSDYFIQLEPFRGDESSLLTKIYSTYDETYIYFGIKCYDPEPEKIVASVQLRDNLSKSDDALFIILDTFNDQRSAFVFGINPLGTQTDLRIRDDGRNTDTNWDAQWSSAASKSDSGWTAEFAIPFSSLGYDENIKSWGINFRRIFRRNFEISYWDGPLTYDYQISRQGKLHGLELPIRQSTFILTPYTTLRFENTEESNNQDEFNAEIGGDLTINFTPGLQGNITYNPDFATVEGDQETINLSRYELSYPEKRLFFMESNELYSTRIQTFYSRRIGDIDWGAKATGKIGDYSLSTLFVKSPRIDTNVTDNFSTFRLKKDIFKSSSVGFTFADKSWENGFTRSLSLDYVLNFDDTWKFTGQWVGSTPGDMLSHSAWFVRFANESNTHHLHVRYSNLGENFQENVNQTGFITDDDRREIDAELTYTWWFNKSLFKYIFAKSNNNSFWSQQGILRGNDFQQEVRFYFDNKISLEIENNLQYRLFEKDFYNYNTQIELGYNTDEWESVKFGYEWGKNFDLDFKLYELELSYSPIENLAFKYTLEKVEFDPDPEKESTIINVLALDYRFTRDLWLRLFVQNNSTEDRIYFYGLFGWRFIPPFSALYLIYTYDDFLLDDSLFRLQNKILFFKISYQFNF